MRSVEWISEKVAFLAIVALVVYGFLCAIGAVLFVIYLMIFEAL